MRALSDLATLVVLNIVTLVASIPIVTAGAALSALHFCVMKMQDGDGDLLKTFWKQWKGNLKSSTPVWLVDLLAILFVYLDLQIFLGPDGKFTLLLVPVYAIAILMFALFTWIFPLLSRFENSFGASWKNALILAIGALPQTLLMMVLWFVFIFLTTQVTTLLPLFFVFGISVPAYVTSFLYYPVLKKLMGNEKKNFEDK